MSLDFSALDALDTLVPAGTPARAPLSMFYEDPDQPRTEFDENFLGAFAAEVKEAGSIHTAINVRPPDADGRMKIIHGAQRYRASVMAGVPDIPYLIQTDTRVFDEYSQVSENQRRRSLTPKELALFINGRVAKGESQSHVAQKLGMNKAEVTYHMALINAPDFIVDLYHQNKCMTPKYLYELANLAKTHPEEVRVFCSQSEEFTRPAIAALASRLKAPAAAVSISNAKPTHARISGAAAIREKAAGTDQVDSPRADCDPMTDGSDDSNAGVESRNMAVRNSNEKGADAAPAGQFSQREELKDPQLRVKQYGRHALVLLDRVPTSSGLVFVRFQDDQSEAEIPFDELKELVFFDGAT